MNAKNLPALYMYIRLQFSMFDCGLSGVCMMKAISS